MKVAYLGGGTWGFALASLLVENGHEVMLWAREKKLVDHLQKTKKHPKLKGYEAPFFSYLYTKLEDVLKDAEVIVESVTSKGIRPVFEEVVRRWKKPVPIVLTSKGIEQKTGLLLCDVVAEVIGKENLPLVGCLSGPSHAEEVVRSLPTSVVAASFDPRVSELILALFNGKHFRVLSQPGYKRSSFWSCYEKYHCDSLRDF